KMSQIFIFTNFILLILTRTPKLIKHLSTEKFLTAMGTDISLTEDQKGATQFCLKVVDGFNNLSIQLCDKDEVEQAEHNALEKKKNTEHEKLNSHNVMTNNKDSLRKSSLVGPLSAVEAIGGTKKLRNLNPNEDSARLSLTVQAPVLDTEKMTGIEVNLEPERPTPAQAFQIIQADDAGTVRIMNASLCLTLKESDGTIGKKSDQFVAAPCNPKDLNNQFMFIELSKGNNRQLDETKLAALKEAARVSPKLREKIGMDYLELMS
ncbi:hypothetical protein M153_82380002, partial [Pseudoloma neurophilia]